MNREDWQDEEARKAAYAGAREDNVGAEVFADAIRAHRRMRAALEAIIHEAPTEEPEYDDWGGDTERAENWGGAQEHWRCAEIARKGLGTEDIASATDTEEKP